jgi:outer membrane protein
MVMKKILMISLLLFSLISNAAAQKTGYVNTEEVFSEMSEYTMAQQQLERLRQQYEVQVESEIKEIEALFNKYQAEKGMLTEAQRDEREREIISREREVKERQQEIFGQDGVFAEKSRELLDPLRERVQNAINETAREMGYALIIDVAAVQGVVYKDESLNITPFVISKVGKER